MILANYCFVFEGPIKFDQDAENNADIHIDMISNASPRHKMLIKAAQQTIPFGKQLIKKS